MTWKTITTIILLGLSLLTALTLETRMTEGAAALMLIFAGAIMMSGILFGTWTEAKWTTPFSALVFSLSLVYLIWTFLNLNTFIPFAFGILVNVAGLVMCLFDTQKFSWAELETYNLDAFEKRKKKK